VSERIAEAPSRERGDFPAVRPAPSTSRLRKWLMARLQWFSVLGLIIILEVIGRLGFSRVIPPFSDVVRNLVDLARTGKLDTITLSFQALGIGFGLALICGLGLAIATTTWKTLDYVVEPYINAFMSMPTSALIPVLMIIFGLGQTTRIVVVFIYAFFVIVVNTQAGLRQIDPNLAEMARAVRPGGKVLVLEFGQPEGGIFGALYRFYSHVLLPRIGGWLTGEKDAYRYLQRTSASFPCGERFLSLMRETEAFSSVQGHALTGGIAYAYLGIVQRGGL